MKVLSDMSAERTYSNYFRPALLVVLILGAVFALASTLAFSSVSARADDGRFAGGTGTANDPYQIATAAQLENLANWVNDGKSSNRDHYVLVANIDLKGSSYSANNTVIGYADSFKDASTHGFKGTFDGNGYTIKNLNVDLSKVTAKGGTVTVGLFGAVQNATIKNLNLQDVVFVGAVPNAASNDIAVGCLAGAVFGKTVIDHCSVMNGSITENTTGAGTATKLYSFGGLLGDAYTTGETAFASVTNCSIDCEITAFGGHSSQSYVGGIVGRGRVNSNDNRWRAVEVGLSAFTGTLKGNGYNAPIIAGVRRGASESAATGTAIARAVDFNKCFYWFSAYDLEGKSPNPAYNPTESDAPDAKNVVQADPGDSGEDTSPAFGNSTEGGESVSVDPEAENPASEDAMADGLQSGNQSPDAEAGSSPSGASNGDARSADGGTASGNAAASPSSSDSSAGSRALTGGAAEEFVYNKDGSYVWGDARESAYYDDDSHESARTALEDSGKAKWRSASKNNSQVLVLDMRTPGISLGEPHDGYYDIVEGFFGLYNGETNGALENPVWSSNVIKEPSPHVGLSTAESVVTLTYGPVDSRKTVSCTIPALSGVSVSVHRVEDDQGKVIRLDASVEGGESWGLAEGDFAYTWYKGDSAEGEIVGEGSSLDVAGFTDKANFTVKAVLTANDEVAYTATGSNYGRTLYVNESEGDDGANGRTPDTAVKTIPQAYELLDEQGTAESNVIVVIGKYTDNSYGVEPAGNGQPNAFNKPATITGYDPLNPTLNAGQSAFSGDDARFNDFAVLSWENSEKVGQRGKFLYAETIVKDIVLSGGTTQLGYVYCQGNDLTIEQNVKMFGYSRASVEGFGLLPDTNVPNFHVVGGYLDKNDRATGQNADDACDITIRGGCYARILAGSRNTQVNEGSRNTFGSEGDYFKSNIVVDIQQTSRGTYNCDVGMLCGGQTDGSLYAASKVTLNAGYAKLFLGSSIGFNRSTGDAAFPNNDFIGLVDATVNGGTVDQLYGGCLGRWRDTADKELGIDSAFKRSDAIRRAEHLSETQADIRIIVNGGVINPGAGAAGAVFACGAGGTTGTLFDPVATSIEVNGGTIKGSVYGGGDGKTTTGDQSKASTTAGTLYGETRVAVNSGVVEGDVYGGGAGTSAYLDNAEKRALAQVFGSTEVTVSGGVVAGSVYGGGNGIESEDAPHMARVTGNTRVLVAGGSIGGDVYGGGSLGAVGEGSVTGIGMLPYAVTSPGSTTVVVSGGSVAGSVFGGGKGFGQGTSDQALLKGALFGSSTVKVYGGSVGDDLFGGGNESRIYAPVSNGMAQRATTVIANSTNGKIVVQGESAGANAGKVVAEEGEGTRIEDDLVGADASSGVMRSVDLGGSVFGGGNRSKLSGSQQANDYTVYGDTNVFIKGAGVSFVGENGGVYGDGNVSKAYGTRRITLIDFKNEGANTDPLKVFYSLQRADRVVMSNSKVYTRGALDRVNAVDTAQYAVNRVQSLKLYDGSTVQLDTVVNGLGSIWSDVESGRNFRSESWRKDELEEYRKACESGEPWTSRNPDGSGGTTYPSLNAIVLNNGKQLDVAYTDDELPSTGKYGQVTGLFTLSLLTPAFDEGGAFVLGATGSETRYTSSDSTGHFACVTKDAENGSYLDLLTEQKKDYRLWYIKGHDYQYDVTLKGYTTGNTTVSAQVWLPVDRVEDDDEAYLMFDTSDGRQISIPDTLDLKEEGDTLGENEMQLRLDVNADEDDNSPYYFTKEGEAPDDEFEYEDDDTLVPVTLSMTLGPTMKASNGSEVSFWLKDANEEGSSYKFTVRIIIELPASDGYAIKRYGKIYGDVPFGTVTPITSRSAYTTEFVSTYSPAAYSGKSWSIIPYWDGRIAERSEGYEDGRVAWFSRFNAGLKITMVDLTNASNPQYYFYECKGGETEIDLDSFAKMNGDGLFSATKTGNTVIREKLVFIVDYENASTEPDFETKYLMLKHSYNHGANDILRYTDYHDDGSVSAEHYAPAVQQQIVMENNDPATGIAQGTSLESLDKGTSSDYLFDVYRFKFTFSLRTDVVNTRLEANDYSLLLWFQKEINFPLGSSIVVSDAQGNQVETRYVRLKPDGKTERACVIANIQSSGSYTIKLQLSRYLSYGRILGSQYSEFLRANLYSSSDGLYSFGDPGQLNTSGIVSYLGAEFASNPVAPRTEYNLKLDSIAAQGNEVTARLTASKESAKKSVDLAPNNGLVAKRQIKGDPSSSVEVSDKVNPGQGNANKATTFTLNDTVPGPGTYEYTFLYGTTFEAKTVTVS